jgi:hypothetical protein
MIRTLESKVNAAYEHGRKDFLAGTPCNPDTPLLVYRDLTPQEQAVIKQAWVDGWKDAADAECLMQALPDGMPA